MNGEIFLSPSSVSQDSHKLSKSVVSHGDNTDHPMISNNKKDGKLVRIIPLLG